MVVDADKAHLRSSSAVKPDGLDDRTRNRWQRISLTIEMDELDREPQCVGCGSHRDAPAPISRRVDTTW